MRDDYLWDKSGQPDPEIERLEQLLGNLRYRRPAQDLPLPERSPVQTRRSTFTTFLAAAAAVLLMITAAGFWLTLRSNQKETARALAAVVEPGSLPGALNAASISVITVRTTREPNRPEHNIIATGASSPEKPRRATVIKHREPSVALLAKAAPQALRERISEDEGVAAREQLIKALHLTSAKLNQVQRKVLDNKGAGPVS
ncbi:MAG TPA: hypothetical protein VF528_05520 [Pyrinomonadaceae bacterium]|jgi:hypothetical protein